MIAGEINNIMRDSGLRELGQLEQDLVFGDAGTKEVFNFLRLKQLAKLSRADMKTVKNMKLLEGLNSKKASHGTFSLKFDSAKRKHAERQDRTGEEETWALFRFYPKIEELIEKLSKGELPKDEYQCMKSASSSNPGTQGSSGASQAPSIKSGPSAAPHSMRSRRTAT